jgi:2-amino-4-hydroxy-6-hydroxymethyldihydropteridine diphosphokinase
MPVNQATSVYISIGSNIQPIENTRRAILTLQSQLNDCRVSRCYRSAAVGMQGSDFVNAVVSGTTTSSVGTFTQWLRDVEHQQGRVRTENKFADRPLDLDLLLYGEQITNALPHPEITEQAYVLQPLCDIAPDLIHPLHRRSIQHLKAQLCTQMPEKFASLHPIDINITG